MSVFDCQLLRDASLERDPFDHLIVPGLVRGEALAKIAHDFPSIAQPGSLPIGSLKYGPKFGEFIDTLQSSEMTAAIAEKFDVDLANRPTMVTVRAHCRARDGQIHTDSKGKLITVLVYLNEAWEADGGRLRLLRSPDDIDDYVAEVPPDEGTLLAFRCSDKAWHGHKSFEGPRRAIQLNWVVDDAYLRREQRRHRISAFFKSFRMAS